MSAVPQDDDFNIEIGIKNLQQAMKDISKTVNDSLTAGVDRKTLKYTEFLKRQSIMDKQRNQFLEKRYKLMNNARSMELLTRSTGSGMMGGAMNFMSGMGNAKMGDLQRLKELKGEERSKILDPIEAKERNKLQGMKSISILENISDRLDDTFGGTSKWNKMFGGHGKMAAGAMGVGAVGGGISLAKMVIDSSPAFQQLLKLTKFATTLILRPIGDFFGFVFRPILILLLRKFIIPFYQKVYPWFIRNGKILGELLTSFDGFGDAIGTAFTSSLKVHLAEFETMFAKFFPKLKVEDIPKPEDPAKQNVIASKKMDELVEVTKKALPDPNIHGVLAKLTTKQVIANTKVPALEDKTKKVMKKLPVKSKTMDWTDGGKALKTGAKVAADSAKAATTASKVTSGALKTLKILDRVAGLPAEIAIKAIKGTTQIVGGALKTSIGTADKLITGGVGGKVAKTATKPAVEAIGKVSGVIAAKLAGKTASKFIPIVGQVLTAIDAAGSIMKQYAPDQYEGIHSGGVGLMKGVVGEDIAEGVMDFIGFGKQSTAEQLVGLAGAGADLVTGKKREENEGAFGWGGGFFGLAQGGIIREPIKGIGKSGQKYMLGESGSEAVIPMNKMGGNSGTTINITVNGSIYSDKDMLKFQRTIMRAIESSNTRKARL
jgi:hypothetical protein